jgi:hypothetical protein
MKRSRRTGVIDLPTARVDCLQKLIYFFIAHFLAEICEDW